MFIIQTFWKKNGPTGAVVRASPSNGVTYEVNWNRQADKRTGGQVSMFSQADTLTKH